MIRTVRLLIGNLAGTVHRVPNCLWVENALDYRLSLSGARADPGLEIDCLPGRTQCYPRLRGRLVM